MEVTNRDFCDFVVWTPELTRVIRFKRNRECFEYLLPLYTQFAVCLNNDVPPRQECEEELANRKQRVTEFMQTDIVLNAFSNPTVNVAQESVLETSREGAFEPLRDEPTAAVKTEG